MRSKERLNETRDETPASLIVVSGKSSAVQEAERLARSHCQLYERLARFLRRLGGALAIVCRSADGANGVPRLLIVASGFGTVEDFDFNPVVGVEVHLRANGEIVSTTSTDEQGNFLIQTTEGSGTTWRVCTKSTNGMRYHTCLETFVQFQDGAERTLRMPYFFNPNFR